MKRQGTLPFSYTVGSIVGNSRKENLVSAFVITEICLGILVLLVAIFMVIKGRQLQKLNKGTHRTSKDTLRFRGKLLVIVGSILILLKCYEISQPFV